ncbi:MAG: serine hydrolase [Hyphomicrobiales bacterium]|nr:serine hydrolase [Hyphomicrobiales bacterium]
MTQVQGDCETRFEPVRRAFRENFDKNGEVGAAVAVMWRGRPVVDLWGGVSDVTTGAPWLEDTLVCMMSVAKGISAIALSMAYDRGLVDLDAPAARYWPEFAQAGKAEVTVRQAASHLAGVPVADSAADGAMYDYDAMTDAIARQVPLWPPGEKQIYHSATIGHIIGAILKGATGKDLPRFVREDISGQLGVEYFIGLLEGESGRCATMIPSANNLVSASKDAPRESVAYRSFRPLPADEDFNSSRWRASAIPSVNGHGTARAVAKIYGSIAASNANGGGVLGDQKSFLALATEQSRGNSTAAEAYLRMGVGFMLNSPPIRPMGPNMQSFGFSGAGGAQAFADPVTELGFCYACNRMHDGVDIGPRAAALINAAFGCV